MDIVLCALPCPRTQEHQSTWVDLWVHRVAENGHQPLGRCNSLWGSACAILWSNPILKRYVVDIASLCIPLPIDSGTPKYMCGLMSPKDTRRRFGRGNSLWRSACPILWSNPGTRLRNTKVPVWTHKRYFMDIAPPPVNSLALRLRNTKVPVWTHESLGYPKMDISHWDKQFTMAFSSPNIVIKPDPVTLVYGDSPLCTSLT